MSTSTPTDLKAMMRDLEQKKSALAENFNRFEQLQSEIKTLAQRANKGDANAIRKIANLDKAFPNGFEQQNIQLTNTAKELEKNFKVLKRQFQEVGIKAKPKNTQKAQEKSIKENETEINIDKSKLKRPKMRSFC